MTLETGTALSIALSFVGGVIWLIRLEGRVNTGEAVHELLKESHEELKNDVRYVRERIDDALSGRYDRRS